MKTRLFAVQFVGGPSDGVVLTGFPDGLPVPAGAEVVHRGRAPGDKPASGWTAAYHLKCEISSGRSAHWFRYEFAGYRQPGRRSIGSSWRTRVGGRLAVAAQRLAQWMVEPVDFLFDYYRSHKRRAH